jgi:hypothetical protein
MAAMPSTGLDGPYTLSYLEIDKVVPKSTAGMFVLGRTREAAFRVNLIGGHTANLHDTLYALVGKGHEQFKFLAMTDAREAWIKQCAIYHDFKPPGGHPEPAGDHPDWQCPLCGF